MSKAKLAVATILGLLAGSGFDLNGFPDLKSVEISKDDETFLNTLSGAKRDIWSRRVRHGLTTSEREFFEKMKKDAEHVVGSD